MKLYSIIIQQHGVTIRRASPLSVLSACLPDLVKHNNRPSSKDTFFVVIWKSLLKFISSLIMYSMPSNYCPSPIRLMPACPLVPSSPMTGVQTFYITMPSDAAAAMFFDPNLAAVQQQHQTLMMQHAAHQTSMPPFRHMQQHHQMIMGNNTTDSSMPHHPYQTAPSAFFMAASAPPQSPGGAFFQQQLASPLPFYMRPTGQTINQAQMMPGKMAPPTAAPSVPVSAPSPLTVITTSTTSASNNSSPPPSSVTNATTATSSGSNEPATSSDNSSTKRLSPIPCALLEDETLIKAPRSVTSKAIATLTGKLADLLRACKSFFETTFTREKNPFVRYMVIAHSRRTDGIGFHR